MANPQMYVEVVTSGAQSSVTVVGHGDDVGDAFGDDEDFVIVLNADANSANAAITDVLVNTPVTPALAANSAILSNTTASGDILFAVADGSGNSQGLLHLDGSTGMLSVGEDGTGHDVKFFGDTADSYMLWDQSEDSLVVAGNLGIGPAHTVDTILHIESADPILKIQDSSGNGNTANANVGFFSADGTEMGFVGDGTAANSDIYLYANAGNLRFKAEASSTVLIEGTTPTLTIGDAGEEDAKIIFDGYAVDYHIGLDDTADDLVIGVGTGLGTTTAMSISSNLHIGIGAAPSTVQYIEINPTWTATAGNSDTVRILGALTPADENNLSGLYISPTFNRHSSGTHARFVSLDVRAPTIEAIDGKATVTSVALIHIRGDASGGGTNNYQIWDSTNSAFLSTAGVWTDASHGDVKIHTPADLDIMPELLAQLNLKQYHRRSPLYDSDGKVTENEDGSTVWTDTVHSDDSYLRYGPLAEEVPEFLATADRKGIGAGYTAGFLIGVAQNHDARIEALEKALGV